MRLSEEKGIVFGYKPADHNAAGIDADSINTGYCDHVTYLLQFGTLVADSVLTVNSGASDGTKTTAETFYYRLAGADQAATGADVYAAEATSAGLTLTAATYDNKLLIVEMPVSEITTGQPYLTLSVSDAATTLFTSCVAILSGLRYAQNQPPTVIA